MPEAPSHPRIARYSWLVAIAAAYLYLFPYFPKLHSANELPRVYLVKAMVDDHTFSIDHGIARWGGTSDVAEVHSLVEVGPHPRFTTRAYQNKAPGASVVVVPVYALARAVFGPPSLEVTMWLCRIVTGVIPSLALLWLLWGYLARFAPDAATRRLVLFAYALGSMAFTYSVLFYGHQLAAVCLASAWILGEGVADRSRGGRTMAVVGLLAGLAVLVDYQTAFAVVPLVAYLAVRMRTWALAELVRTFALAAAAAVLPLAFLLYYHQVCFGSPFATGYNFSTTYAADHAHGLLGLTHPTWAAIVGTTVAPDNGLFALAPWWLLAIPGGFVLWRRGERPLVVVVATLTVIFFAFVTSFAGWRGGWEVGPRYIVALQPFLLPLVATTFATWRGRPLAFGAACGLVGIGVVIYTGSAATLPMWPDSAQTAFRNPVVEVMFRLLGDNAAAPNVLGALGLHGVLGVVPVFVGVAALVGIAMVRAGAGLRSMVIAIAFVGAGIVAFALVPVQSATASAARAAYARTIYPAVAQ